MMSYTEMRHGEIGCIRGKNITIKSWDFSFDREFSLPTKLKFNENWQKWH